MITAEHLQKVETDWRWADRFIPQIKTIVGPRLLVPAPLETDRHEAADLVVLKARDLTIAARVRRPGYLRYQNQFTIRCQRDNGAKTELQKITEGWGDWLFYGHANEEEDTLAFWWLLDLAAWRAHLIRDRGSIIRGQMPNGDGTHFAWFDVMSFKGNPQLVIAQSE